MKLKILVIALVCCFRSLLLQLAQRLSSQFKSREAALARLRDDSNRAYASSSGTTSTINRCCHVPSSELSFDSRFNTSVSAEVGLNLGFHCFSSIPISYICFSPPLAPLNLFWHPSIQVLLQKPEPVCFQSRVH